MKIGIISDTHENLGAFLDVVDHLRSEGATKIYHLGHHYNDTQNLVNLKRQLTKGTKEYDDTDFMTDLADFMAKQSGMVVPKTNQVDEVGWLKRNLVCIPGKGDSQYGLEAIPSKDFEMIDGKFVCLVHNIKDLSKEDIASANIVFYGDTHLFQVDMNANRYFINPGHMMRQQDKGRPATYAVLNSEQEAMYVEIRGLDHNTVMRKDIVIERKRKFSAG